MVDRGYDALTVPELEAELTRRKLLKPPDARKGDLVRTLEENDAGGGNIAAEATGDGDLVEPGDAPLIGEARDLGGDEIPQVGKHPDLPADVPVSPGSALDPSLPPLEPQKTRVLPEGEDA